MILAALLMLLGGFLIVAGVLVMSTAPTNLNDILVAAGAALFALGVVAGIFRPRGDERPPHEDMRP